MAMRVTFKNQWSAHFGLRAPIHPCKVTKRSWRLLDQCTGAGTFQQMVRLGL